MSQGSLPSRTGNGGGGATATGNGRASALLSGGGGGNLSAKDLLSRPTTEAKVSRNYNLYNKKYISTSVVYCRGHGNPAFSVYRTLHAVHGHVDRAGTCVCVLTAAWPASWPGAA